MRQSDLESKFDRMRNLVAIEVNQWAEQLPDRAPEVVAAFKQDGESGVAQFLNEQAARVKARVFDVVREFSADAASSFVGIDVIAGTLAATDTPDSAAFVGHAKRHLG